MTTVAGEGDSVVTDPGQERRVAVVIEDDLDIRYLLEQVLMQAGFSTVSTGNGEDGVRAVLAHEPVVTTLDVSLPGIDGFEVARRIRESSSTYIVMISAMGDEIDILQGLEAGADDYLVKPFRPRELRARLGAMLRRPRIAEPAAPEVGDPDGTGPLAASEVPVASAAPSAVLSVATVTPEVPAASAAADPPTSPDGPAARRLRRSVRPTSTVRGCTTTGSRSTRRPGSSGWTASRSS